MSDDLSLFTVGYKTEPEPDLNDPLSWKGWKIRFNFIRQGQGVVFQSVLHNVVVSSDYIFLYPRDSWDNVGERFDDRNLGPISLPTNLSTIGLIDFLEAPKTTTASDTGFDSTPSEAMTPEEQIGGLNPIPEEKLRRTNPKRYDQRTDWYSGINEHGHDVPMQNKYDDAPALVSSLKFGYRTEPEWNIGDDVYLASSRRPIGKVLEVLIPGNAAWNKLIADDGGNDWVKKVVVSNKPLVLISMDHGVSMYFWSDHLLKNPPNATQASIKKSSPETRIFDKKEYVDVTGTGVSGSIAAAFGMIRRENKTWIPAKSYKEYMELTECIKKDLEKDSSLLQEIDWEIDSLVESSQIMKTASVGKDDFIKKLIIRSELHDPTPVVEKSIENLFEALEKEYVEPFEKRLEERGEDVHVLWGDGFKPQQKRFMNLVKIGDLEGKSILDIGAGYGDLLDFLKRAGIKVGEYRGIDFSDKMVEIAQRKHPEHEFERRNIRLDPLEEESYDYVFGSGIFFLKHPDWKKYVQEVVESMFKTARIGVAVNFLLKDDKNVGDLNYVLPDEVKEVLRNVTHKLDMYEDMSIEDLTVYLFKDKVSSLKLGYKIEPQKLKIHDSVRVKSKSIFLDPLHGNWVGKEGYICRVMEEGVVGTDETVYEVMFPDGYRRFFLLKDLELIENKEASLKFAVDVPIDGPSEPPQPPQLPPATPPGGENPPKKKRVRKEKQQGKSTKPVVPQAPAAGNAPSNDLSWHALKKTNEEEYKKQLDEQIDQLMYEGSEFIPEMIYAYLGENKSSYWKNPTFLRTMVRRDLANAGYFSEAIQTAFDVLRIDEIITDVLDEEFGWGGWEGGTQKDNWWGKGQSPSGEYDYYGRNYMGGKNSYVYEPPKIDIGKASKEVGDWLLKYFDHEQFTLKRIKYLVDKYFPDFYKYRREDEAVINALPTYNAEEFKIEGNVITVGKPPQPGEGEAQVPQNIEMNMDELKEVSLSSIEEFAPYGEKLDTKDGMYVFIDNGADILAVAHLDTVQDIRHFDVKEGDLGKVIKNAQLDDRLGAYIILKLLPQLGVKADILLTEGEEVGRSTAKHFLTQKKYNWVFQFDRQGIDTVMYQYEDPETKKLMEKYKFMVGKGSVSDISYLEKLGIKAFNFGTGYYDNHSVDSYAVESDIKHNIKLFLKFYNDMKDTKLEHKVPEKKQDKWEDWDRGGGDKDRITPSLKYEQPKPIENPFKVGDRVKFVNAKSSLEDLVKDEKQMKVLSDPDIIGEVVSVRDKQDYDEETDTVKNAGITVKFPDDSEWNIPLSNWKQHVKRVDETGKEIFPEKKPVEVKQPETLNVGDRVQRKKNGEIGMVLEINTGNRGVKDSYEIKYPSGRFLIKMKSWKKFVDKIGESEETNLATEFKVGDKVKRKIDGSTGEITEIDATDRLHIKFPNLGTYIINKSDWDQYIEKIDDKTKNSSLVSDIELSFIR